MRLEEGVKVWNDNESSQLLGLGRIDKIFIMDWSTCVFRGLLTVAAYFSLLLMVGCQNRLFPEDTPRTPYERYQAFRGETVPADTEDPYGREVPNLRGRLAPLDSR